jgi:uncharacterized protein (DUF433 family)
MNEQERDEAVAGEADPSHEPATRASWISKQSNRCGGDACVRDTRIPVWTVANYRRLGASDARILEAYPSLTPGDLEAVWAYVADHREEIDRAIWFNEAVMVELHAGELPLELIREGQRLGLSDEEIRDAFEPPLSPDALHTVPAGEGSP